MSHHDKLDKPLPRHAAEGRTETFGEGVAAIITACVQPLGQLAALGLTMVIGTCLVCSPFVLIGWLVVLAVRGC